MQLDAAVHCSATWESWNHTAAAYMYWACVESELFPEESGGYVYVRYVYYLLSKAGIIWEAVHLHMYNLPRSDSSPRTMSASICLE